MVQLGDHEEKTFGQKCSDGFTGFKTFLYNSENGEVMGRSGSSWAKIGLFYFIFYGFLAGFFVAMLAVFMTTVNQPGEGGPKLTQFIKNQPGLVRLDRENKLQGYSVNDTDRITQYSDLIKSFLDGYNDSIKCGNTHCSFNISKLGACSGESDETFGLASRKPCIFLRVNKVYGWNPHNDGSDLLKIKCSGGQPIPEGFQLSSFPFEGQAGYLSPVVAIQIDTTTSGSKTADCFLQGKDIKVSDSYNPSRSYGKIKIDKVSSTA